MLTKRYLLICLLITAPLYIFAAAESSPAQPPVVSHPKWVDVQDIKHSLHGKEPIAVGFDVDDTVLFSSPSLFAEFSEYCPKALQDYRNDNYKMSCFNSQDFWDKVNATDNYNLPKYQVQKLIQMHRERGDNIYFITLRPPSKHSKENLTAVLQRDLDFKDINPVIFMGDLTNSYPLNAKETFIKKHNISIFYGDSDVDIKSAQAAHARGIRVMRAVNSIHYPLPVNGALGEEILRSSDV